MTPTKFVKEGFMAPVHGLFQHLRMHIVTTLGKVSFGESCGFSA